MAVSISLGLLLATTAATVTINRVETEEAHRDLWRVPNFNYSLLDLTSTQLRILPTKFSNEVSSHSAANDVGKLGGIKATVANMASIAYQFKPGRILFPAGQPREEFDFIATLPQGNEEALKRELKGELGFVGRLDNRDMDVLALKVRNPKASGLHQARIGTPHNSWWGRGSYRCDNLDISSVVASLESYLKTPVIDETGLAGNFQFDLKWNEMDNQDPNHDSLMKALQNQLGLELVPDHQTIEVLVLERMK
jgi:uncharacterized protein (TIGR03435 family)